MNFLVRIFCRTQQRTVFSQVQSLMELLSLNTQNIPDTSYAVIQEQGFSNSTLYFKNLKKSKTCFFDAIAIRVSKYDGRKKVCLVNSDAKNIPLHLLEAFVIACDRIYNLDNTLNPNDTFENNAIHDIYQGHRKGRTWEAVKDQPKVTMRLIDNRLELNIEII